MLILEKWPHKFRHIHTKYIIIVNYTVKKRTKSYFLYSGKTGLSWGRHSNESLGYVKVRSWASWEGAFKTRCSTTPQPDASKGFRKPWRRLFGSFQGAPGTWWQDSPGTERVNRDFRRIVAVISDNQHLVLSFAFNTETFHVEAHHPLPTILKPQQLWKPRGLFLKR